MNPLMQMLGGHPAMRNIQNVISQVNQLRQMGDPAAFIQSMAQRNPQFAQFIRDNQGKAPEEVAQSYGLDWSEIQKFMK
jgi:hypothetical protein